MRVSIMFRQLMMKLQSMEIGVHREISVIADLEEAAAAADGVSDGTKVLWSLFFVVDAEICRRRADQSPASSLHFEAIGGNV